MYQFRQPDIIITTCHKASCS